MFFKGRLQAFSLVASAKSSRYKGCACFQRAE